MHGCAHIQRYSTRSDNRCGCVIRCDVNGDGSYANREGVLQYVGVEGGRQCSRIRGNYLETCVVARRRCFVASYHQVINLLGAVFRRNLYLMYDCAHVQRYDTRTLNRCGGVIRFGTYR